MAEYHGAPEAGQLPRVWTRGRTETESRQRMSGAKSPRNNIKFDTISNKSFTVGFTLSWKKISAA